MIKFLDECQDIDQEEVEEWITFDNKNKRN